MKCFSELRPVYDSNDSFSVRPGTERGGGTLLWSILWRCHKVAAIAEGAAAATIGASCDVNTAGNPTEVAMAYLQDEVTFDNVSRTSLVIYSRCRCFCSVLSPISIHNKRVSLMNTLKNAVKWSRIFTVSKQLVTKHSVIWFLFFFPPPGTIIPCVATSAVLLASCQNRVFLKACDVITTPGVAHSTNHQCQLMSQLLTAYEAVLTEKH